ncbi:TMEM165/GDT1 family protein [Rhodococcus sp. BP-252]|uniref:TMEM165/GDT1 family protein n=1 Tax=unclassified Rhodococcus (in: high G+C Gram-positive bacteria) TaxID=192944 RepID=UPI001C9BA4D7|nr:MULTISPECIES: TMEM165/GDT1 family protein [unclassified Rhodococcus (in: high G+C Gram-positive bacteria)]MBY6411798.1 TMEM165/GDT1 family protein [Rhodococcus sp. BP-320]MBY6416574.1 TMEM165/GDT1 family protein [Rhodococcus sp. BP-321]MBY6420620.1 TMEM165/GDT1 family protein [Rhodococcus sp. BP-324]MBY6426598.1 TMEM165/GDT1 family protein [Rhodococcus sp. BP-323]MBY6431597.1 TMEM165/GDT1 family protein [Rhodococcus sp. BP-322]
MLSALFLSFAVIFVAELGDKSQLMAMTFALRYKWYVVIGGITAATAVTHLVSVAVGHFLGLSIPTHIVSIVAGIAFVIFGLWTLRGDSLSDEEGEKASKVGRSAFIAIASAFLLAELGDKTMLATVTLAADNNWFGVWIGSTVGMVAADALAIVVGAVLGKHLPENFIRIGAAVLFLVFGVSLFFDGVMPETAAPAIGAAVVFVVSVIAWIAIAATRRRKNRDEVSFEQQNVLNDK